MARRGGLKDGGEEALASRQRVDFGVVQVQHNDQQRVHEVETEDDAEQDPGGSAWEEQGVTSAGVVQKIR